MDKFIPLTKRERELMSERDELDVLLAKIQSYCKNWERRHRKSRDSFIVKGEPEKANECEAAANAFADVLGLLVV